MENNEVSYFEEKLIIARALQRRGWAAVHRDVTHACGGPLEFSTSMDQPPLPPVFASA